MSRIDRLMGYHKLIKLYLRVFCILLLYCYRDVKGVVEISPSGVAPVCQVGDQLELMCTVTGMFMRWEFIAISESGAAMTLYMSIVTSDGPSGVNPPVTINSTRFTLSRLSAQDDSPLTSKMTINPVSEGLNGVQVNCIDVVTSESATTTIRIIDGRDMQASNLNVRSHTEWFLSNRVMIILEWTLSDLPSYYQQLLQNVSVSTIPDIQVPTTNIVNMSVQLTLEYNILYNVSVTQPGICRQPNQTAYIQLNYVKCSNPMDLTRTNVMTVGYDSPALVGESITFTCTSGLVLTGPNSSMCMENGEWEPDPREMNCTGTGTTTSSGVTTLQPIRDSGNDPIKIVLGTVVGVILGITVAVIIVILLAIILKGFHKHHTRELEHRNFGVESETNGDPSSHSCKIQETFLYADIGAASFPQQQKSILPDFDDSRVEYALLNHSLHEDKVSTLQESPTVKNNIIIESDNCPSINLDSLLIQLQPHIAPKWYEFGEAAGIEKAVLDKFTEHCSPEQCIVEMLDYWLRNSLKQPTWKMVADVLKAIDLTELGLDIERVYITGTLPIEVDMNCVPKLATEGDSESPPPLPARSANMYSDAPSHTINSGSRGQEPKADASLLPPSLSSETAAPALPPKPANIKRSVNF